MGENGRIKKEELSPLFYLFSIIKYDQRGLSISIDHSMFRYILHFQSKHFLCVILFRFIVIMQKHIVQISNSNKAIDINISVLDNFIFSISEQKSLKKFDRKIFLSIIVSSKLKCRGSDPR